MEELRNLQQIYSLAAGKFNQYDGNDFVLPLTFKEQVKEINGNSVTYNNYSAIIQTKGFQRGFLNIYLPNQWFYMASYFTDFYNELIRYKKYALKVTTKERLKVLDKGSLSVEEENSLQSLDLNDTSKNNLMILPKYSQYYASELLFQNIKEHMRPSGDGKGGTYFGATGCGKSYTMLFLTRFQKSHSTI